MGKSIIINPALEYTYKNALELSLRENEKIVIFSDFHMGNGKSRDDFANNANLAETVLREYYLNNNWNLILNGDIEELQKFPLPSIRHKWQSIYELFTDFHGKGKLYKICGNHDDKLIFELSHQQLFPLYDAIRLNWSNQEFFIYHGHQSSGFYSRFNKLIEFGLHYIVRPLGIKNYSDRDNNRKKHRLEKHSYLFSQYKKTVSIIGHTHRPLFESQSIKQTLLYQMEYLLRNYRNSAEKEHDKLRKKIQKLKSELDNLSEEERFGYGSHHIYSEDLAIPCLFNSGCAIGKRGITCIELHKGKIALSYWFDSKIPQKRSNILKKSESLNGSDFMKHTIKIDDVSYISDCIDLFLS